MQVVGRVAQRARCTQQACTGAMQLIEEVQVGPPHRLRALAGRCLGGCSTHGPSTRGREPRRGLATAGTAEERHRGREIMVAQCVVVASGRGFEV